MTAELKIAGRPPAQPWGSCFDAAAMAMLFHLPARGAVLCHGVGTANKPGEEGTKIAHAWLEFYYDVPGKGKTCCAWDPIWQLAQEASHYRKTLKVEYIVTYTRQKLMEMWGKYDFPGPYDKKVMAHVSEAKQNPGWVQEQLARMKTHDK